MVRLTHLILASFNSISIVAAAPLEADSSKGVTITKTFTRWVSTTTVSAPPDTITVDPATPIEWITSTATVWPYTITYKEIYGCITHAFVFPGSTFTPTTAVDPPSQTTVTQTVESKSTVTVTQTDGYYGPYYL
jgi:hypothetical protein